MPDGSETEAAGELAASLSTLMHMFSPIAEHVIGRSNSRALLHKPTNTNQYLTCELTCTGRSSGAASSRQQRKRLTRSCWNHRCEKFFNV